MGDLSEPLSCKVTLDERYLYPRSTGKKIDNVLDCNLLWKFNQNHISTKSKHYLLNINCLGSASQYFLYNTTFNKILIESNRIGDHAFENDEMLKRAPVQILVYNECIGIEQNILINCKTIRLMTDVLRAITAKISFYGILNLNKNRIIKQLYLPQFTNTVYTRGNLQNSCDKDMRLILPIKKTVNFQKLKLAQEMNNLSLFVVIGPSDINCDTNENLTGSSMHECCTIRKLPGAFTFKNGKIVESYYDKLYDGENNSGIQIIYQQLGMVFHIADTSETVESVMIQTIKRCQTYTNVRNIQFPNYPLHKTVAAIYLGNITKDHNLHYNNSTISIRNFDLNPQREWSYRDFYYNINEMYVANRELNIKDECVKYTKKNYGFCNGNADMPSNINATDDLSKNPKFLDMMCYQNMNLKHVKNLPNSDQHEYKDMILRHLPDEYGYTVAKKIMNDVPLVKPFITILTKTDDEISKFVKNRMCLYDCLRNDLRKHTVGGVEFKIVDNSDFMSIYYTYVMGMLLGYKYLLNIDDENVWKNKIPDVFSEVKLETINECNLLELRQQLNEKIPIPEQMPTDGGTKFEILHSLDRICVTFQLYGFLTVLKNVKFSSKACLVGLNDMDSISLEVICSKTLKELFDLNTTSIVQILLFLIKPSDLILVDFMLDKFLVMDRINAKDLDAFNKDNPFGIEITYTINDIKAKIMNTECGVRIHKIENKDPITYLNNDTIKFLHNKEINYYTNNDIECYEYNWKMYVSDTNNLLNLLLPTDIFVNSNYNDNLEVKVMECLKTSPKELYDEYFKKKIEFLDSYRSNINGPTKPIQHSFSPETTSPLVLQMTTPLATVSTLQSQDTNPSEQPQSHDDLRKHSYDNDEMGISYNRDLQTQSIEKDKKKRKQDEIHTGGFASKKLFQTKKKK
uniref:ORF32 n=1 Tax=Malaco herpesvirus 2 TaxID=3031798 RepID=A0AA48SFE7_9VIRU|nr:TPA_asm: ORF32 [Malaco herpesvirus 2]